DSNNIANISSQTTRSIFGSKILKLYSLPEGLCEITAIYIDKDFDSVYETILGPDEFYYYFSIWKDSRIGFIQYNDMFIEQSTYNIKIEYKYSESTVDFPFFLSMTGLVSDIYDTEIIVYDIQDIKISKQFDGLNIDYHGPVITPLFLEGEHFNSTASQLSFEVIDQNGVESVDLYFSKKLGYQYWTKSDKTPWSPRSFVETSSGDLFMVDPSDRRTLLKSSDSGDTWQSYYSSQCYFEQFLFYDQTNERLFYAFTDLDKIYIHQYVLTYFQFFDLTDDSR
ncbi:unnamed protein product, partial [marine sediment metagenome]